jgi:hypothetical protein
MSERERFRPFSNGSEMADWQEANCATCRLGYDIDDERYRCSMQREIDGAYLGDGTIAAATADRIGRGKRWGLANRCAEHRGAGSLDPTLDPVKTHPPLPGQLHFPIVEG